MRTKLLLALLFLGAQAILSAQTGLKLGDNPGTIDAASLLEMESTSLVFVPTRMTTAQMNAITPLDGALIYNTTEEALFYFESGVWSQVGNITEVGNNLFAGSLTGDSNISGARNAAYGFRSFRFNTAGNNNTAMGAFSLESTTNANNNSAFGFNALRDVNANSNSAFGSFALRFNSTGVNNNAFGVNSLRTNVSGGGNSAFGTNALRENIDGNNNSAFGLGSLQLALGLNNSAFGRLALQQLINGNNNVAVGNTAGRLNEDDSFLTDVANSVFIGNGARSQANGQNNQIVIGNGAIGNGANTVTIGNSAISDNFFNGNVDITGEFRVNGTPISGGGGTGLTNPLEADLDAAGFDILNLNFLGMNDGNRNVFVGEGTGQSSSTGQSNFALGYLAFPLNDSGTSNVAIGDQTMALSLSGNINTAVGNQSLGKNIDGSRNVAIGHRAILDNENGSDNTGVGTNAIRQVAIGNANTGIGSAAGRFIAAGTPNLVMDEGVMIGANSRAAASGGTNETVIGYAAVGNGSNTVTIGNDSVTDVHLGSGYIFSGDAAPASSSAPGETGEIRIDTNFIYVCVAPNSWVRAALSSW